MAYATILIKIETPSVYKEQSILERVDKGLKQFIQATKGEILKYEVQEEFPYTDLMMADCKGDFRK